LLCSEHPDQLFFQAKCGQNDPIIKISAKCNSSAAISDRGNLHVWGDAKSGKNIDGQVKTD
jgi:hypothetical protein